MQTFKQFYEAYLIESISDQDIEKKMDQAKKSSLNIPRKLMPQLPETTYKDLEKFLKNNNVSYKTENIKATRLKFAQAEFHIDKIKRLIYNINVVKNKVTFITKDNYILDGNHRIITHQLLNNTVKVTRINMNFKDLVELLKQFKGTEYREDYETV